MSAAGGAAGGAAVAAAAAAIANAIKASGAIVRIEPTDFTALLENHQEALVIVSEPGGIFNRRYQYLTSYKGFVFYCKSDEKIPVPARTEVIHANDIWIPT
jgi:hypothetical protein